MSQEVTGGMAHLSMARPSEEPECLKRWKVEQEEKLRRKDADEEVSKEERENMEQEGGARRRSK